MNDQTKEAVELLLSNRLFLYSLMHKLFGREPDEELLNILTDEHTGEAFGLLSEEEKDIMDRTAVFLGEIREEKQNPAFLEEAKDEYTRLFIGPMSLVAPPWESVYGQKDAMLFQESTLEVRNTYRQYGLIPEGYPHVADDSLALELHFMALLAQRSLDAFYAGENGELNTALRGSSEFLKKHLLVWVPKFLERMKGAKTNILYPQMCLVLDEFLRKDAETVKEVLQALD